MNKSVSKETTESSHVGSLSVVDGFCDKDSHSRRKSAKAAKHVLGKSEAERAISMVYHNDLLMRYIISFVTNINDRVNVEASSSRLRMISKTSIWRFISGGQTLSMTYKTFNDYVSVEIGDVWFAVPSTTMQNRMNGTTRKIEQPAKLIKTLHGMAERFSLGIQNVQIGGTDVESRNRGVQNHQMIVTSDLLRFINDRLKNIRAISFSNCGFDAEAVAYLCSDACTFPKRIRELTINSIWFDSVRLIQPFMRLISSSLRVVKLESFLILPFGTEMLGRMQEVGLVLDDFFIRVSSFTMHGLSLQDVRTFLEKASAATNELRVDIFSSQRRRGDGFLPLRGIPTLGNITELHLCVQPVNRLETEDLVNILNNLGKLTCLRKISCGDWKSYALSVALRNGLMDCSSVNEVSISNIIDSRHDEISTVLLGIPGHVQSVTLKYISITDMDLVYMCKRLPFLRKLHLVKLPRISSHGIYEAISLLSNLSLFHCSTPVSSVLLRSIVISKYLKELRELTLIVTSGLPEDYEELLSQYFFDVCCTKHRSKPRWSYIEARGRRSRV